MEPGHQGRLESQDVRRLLDRLCVELGFCLPPDTIEHLANEPPECVRDFTDEVFRCEGLEPSTAGHLYRRVRDVVSAAFRLAELPP